MVGLVRVKSVNKDLGLRVVKDEGLGGGGDIGGFI